jgi:predicted RNA polymerase sigma factor
LLRRLGRLGEAVEEYKVALSLVRNEAERRFLEDRLQSLEEAPGSD